MLEVRPESVWNEDPHESANPHIVGISIPNGWRLTNPFANMTARHRESRKRKNRSSDEGYYSASSSSSDKSTFSTFDPETESGFSFMQLGKVFNINPSTYEAAESQGKESSDYYWTYAGYILGVTTNGPDGMQPGTPGEVWLVYDFHPQDDASGEVVDIEDHGPFDQSWGYLVGQQGKERDLTKRRGGFKIANSFDELGLKFQWNIEKSFEESYDLIPTRVLTDKALGRFVVNQPMPPKAGAERSAAELELETA